MFWWLSFADPDLPKGSQLLGAAIVEASDFAGAVAQAHSRGCNPGGDCLGAELEDELAQNLRPDEANVLMTREQIDELGDRLRERQRQKGLP